MLVDNIHLSLALKKKNQAHDKDENDNSAVGSELYVLSKVHIWLSLYQGSIFPKKHVTPSAIKSSILPDS